MKNCKIFAVFRLILIFSCNKPPQDKKCWTIKSKEGREKTYGQGFICLFFKSRKVKIYNVLTQNLNHLNCYKQNSHRLPAAVISFKL